MREIAGKKPKTDLKAKVWRIYAELEPSEINLWDPEGINKIATCIGMVYGLDADTVLEELQISELVKVLNECFGYVIDMVNGRIPESKNAIGDGQN